MTKCDTICLFKVITVLFIQSDFRGYLDEIPKITSTMWNAAMTIEIVIYHALKC